LSRNINDIIAKIIASNKPEFSSENKFAVDDGLHEGKIVAVKIKMGVEVTYEGQTKTQNQIQFAIALEGSNGFGIAPVVCTRKFNMVISDKSTLCKAFAKVMKLDTLEDIKNLLGKSVLALISTNGNYQNIESLLPNKKITDLTAKVYLPKFFKVESEETEFVEATTDCESTEFSFKANV
jgi:predicted regulator of amino acid metabolism with ACT domain